MTLNVTFIQIIDLVGTFAFAISGVRLAARKEFDLFGAFVVGFVTAVGGGTLRDLLLDVPPFWIQTKSYVLVTLLALLVTIAFKKWIVKFNYTFFIFDAIGLGLFTVVGLEKSLAAGNPMWVNIIMGCITGAAGGIFRDVLINEVPLIFRKDIYALACIIGGIVYWICYRIQAPIVLTQLIAALSVILTRVLAVHFNVCLPSLSPEPDPNSKSKE